MIEHYLSLPPQLLKGREVVYVDADTHFAKSGYINLIQKFISETEERLFKEIDMALKYGVGITTRNASGMKVQSMNGFGRNEEYVIVQPIDFLGYFYEPGIGYYAYVSCMPKIIEYSEPSKYA